MIPADHLLWRIDVFATAVLGDLHEQLSPIRLQRIPQGLEDLGEGAFIAGMGGLAAAWPHNMTYRSCCGFFVGAQDDQSLPFLSS
jgi:hypothetical protein